MTRPGARRLPKPDTHSMYQAMRRLELEDEREICRQEREAENYQNSTLLKLPGEIRTEIYKHAIVYDEVINTDRLGSIRIQGIKDGVTYQSISANMDEGYEPDYSIAQVCRQIRNEAMGFYYKENIFLLRIVVPKQLSPSEQRFGSSELDSQYAYLWRTREESSKAWVKDLPAEALFSLSRVILLCDERDTTYWANGAPTGSSKGSSVFLFNFDLETIKKLRVEDKGRRPCCIRGTCASCKEQEKRNAKVHDALKPIKRDKLEGLSRAQLLNLLQDFRNCVEASRKAH